MKTRKTAEVTKCDFYGRAGYSCEGYCGETPQEAVHEAWLNGAPVPEIPTRIYELDGWGRRQRRLT